MIAPLSHEELHVRRGERTGLYVIVAIHSTLLGPALGGARLWRYETPSDGIADALRLSQAMTMKAAAAGLDLGGGKCVLCGEGELTPARRRNLMLDLGDAVDSLEGRYITAEDVGTSPEDMVTALERTQHVVGLPPQYGGHGDPSPLTARGVAAAIGACLRSRFGDPSPAGRTVCVIGLGHVGLSLAHRLAAAGAELIVTDIDDAKRRDAAEVGARWIEPSDAVGAECDVLAPCALGGLVDAESVRALRCEVLCGAANNVLAEDALASELQRRGILYLPDFVANAGGLINVYAELHDFAEERVTALVDGIGEAADRVLAAASEAGATPLAAAHQVARERLDEARRPAGPARLTA